MRQGWPLGEAMTRAQVETAVEWARGPSPPREQPAFYQLQQKGDQGGKGGKGAPQRTPRTASTLPSGERICKRYNDNRGCKKEASCPLKHRHVCDMLKSDGTVCAGMHPRKKCKLAVQ